MFIFGRWLVTTGGCRQSLKLAGLLIVLGLTAFLRKYFNLYQREAERKEIYEGKKETLKQLLPRPYASW